MVKAVQHTFLFWRGGEASVADLRSHSYLALRLKYTFAAGIGHRLWPYGCVSAEVLSLCDGGSAAIACPLQNYAPCLSKDPETLLSAPLFGSNMRTLVRRMLPVMQRWRKQQTKSSNQTLLFGHKNMNRMF